MSDDIGSSLSPSARARLAKNLALVRSRIAAAAGASGRPPETVTLVAVTKYSGDDAARALVEVGCTDLGESRPQELWHKASILPRENVRWHLIGHLQRNKVDRTLPLVSLIHSLDSLRLAETVQRAAALLDRKVPVLLEVNVSGDAAKHGFAPAELEPLVEIIPQWSHLEVRGLMAMAGLDADRATTRAEFAGLRALRDRLCKLSAGRLDLSELSMGMSDDYEIAIEEGSTIVRVGSALFDGVL